MNVYCAKCEALNRETDAICSQCGHRLIARPARPAAAPPPVAASAPVQSIEIKIPLGRWAYAALGLAVLIAAVMWRPAERSAAMPQPPVPAAFRRACPDCDDSAIRSIIEAALSHRRAGLTELQSFTLMWSASLQHMDRMNLEPSQYWQLHDLTLSCIQGVCRAVYAASTP